MNIPHTLHQKPLSDTPSCCPACRSSRFSIHGYYWRKGFHVGPRGSRFTQRVQVLRYLCLNPECPSCTFSHPPSMVLRFCRFFWPDLLSLQESVAAGCSEASLAKIWQVGRKVIQRALLFLNQLPSWIASLHQEVTNGLPTCTLTRMVKIIISKIGRSQLLYRWCKYRYPGRFFTKPGTTQINTVMSTMR